MVIDQHRLGTRDIAMDDAVADAREARLTAEVSGKTDLNTARRDLIDQRLGGSEIRSAQGFCALAGLDLKRGLKARKTEAGRKLDPWQIHRAQLPGPRGRDANSLQH